MYGDPSKAMEKDALIIGHRCESRRSIGLRESEEALVLTLRNFSFSLQSKTVRRAVLEVTDCFDHVSNVSLMPARSRDRTTSISAMEGQAHRRRAKAPFSQRSWDMGRAFSASAEGTTRGPSGSKPHGGGGASEGKCRPEAILLAGIRASPSATVTGGERSRSESRRCHRSEDRRCE